MFVKVVVVDQSPGTRQKLSQKKKRKKRGKQNKTVEEGVLGKFFKNSRECD